MTEPQETQQHEQGVIPPKPSLEEAPRPTNWGKTVFTMLLFFAIYLILGFEPVFLLLIVGALLLHEAGHFLAMKAFGYPNVSMIFVPFVGAGVLGEKPNVPYRHQLIVLLAGPLPGLIAGMVMVMPPVSQGNGLMELVGTLLMVLNLLNMLPIFPLDGGRVIETLFTAGNHYLRIGFMSLSLLAIVSYAIFSGHLGLLVLAFFLVMQMTGSFQLIRTRRNLHNMGLNYRTSYEELTDQQYWLLHQAVRFQFPNLKTEHEVSRRVNDLLLYSSSHRLGIGEKILFFLVWAFFLVAPLLVAAWAFQDHMPPAPSDILPSIY